MKSGQDVSKKLWSKNARGLKKQPGERNSSEQKGVEKERRPRVWKVDVTEMIVLEHANTRLMIQVVIVKDQETSTTYEKHRRRRKTETRGDIAEALVGSLTRSPRKAFGKASWGKYERSRTEN
jgi:hypothetical protein